MAYQEEFDEIYDDPIDDPIEDDAGALLPLDHSSIQVGGLGRADDVGGNFRFSAINAGETEVKFNAIFNFLKDYRPESKKTRTLVNGLLRLGMRILNAPACRRQLRFEVADQQAKYWMSRVAKEEKDSIKAADDLLKDWGSADLLQRDIRHRRLIHGLAWVDGERPRYYTATRKKEGYEQQATQLPTPAYEYFQARLEQYRIQRELAEDRAKGHIMADFSDLIKRIIAKAANAAEVAIAIPWPIQEALWVSMQDADVDNPHWKHIEALQAGSLLAAPRRRRSWAPRTVDEGGDYAQG